ncbi:MAG: hypothetical protein HYY06_17355 [Deltaproteobacteria bacterium]|nr:hypothetical protein [Deltaproteobacteria bacterium]
MIRVRALAALAVVLLATLPDSSADPPGPAELAGRVVWDEPAARMPGAIRGAYDEARALLARPLAPPRGADSRPMTQWIEARSALVRRVEGIAAPTPRERLFVAVVGASLLEQMVTELRSVELPRAVRGDPEVERMFRETLDRQLDPIAARARDAYRACAGLQPSALPEPLRFWPDECRQRADALASLVPPPAGPATRAGGPPAEVPAECQGGVQVVDPDAPPADLGQPMEVAILVERRDAIQRDFADADRDRVAAAVRRRLAKLRGLRLIDDAEVRTARRLMAERRSSEGGPVCGQAPPLSSILARSHPHLVIARVEAVQYHGEGPMCELSVSFDRAGSDSSEGLPESLAADAGQRCTDVARVVAAGRRLSPRARAGILGVGARRSSPVAYGVAGSDGDEPWLRVGTTLKGVEQAMTECHPGLGAASWALSWTVSPTGQVVSSEVRPLRAPPSGAEEVRRCVDRVLRATVFPCTPSGRPERARARVCVARTGR